MSCGGRIYKGDSVAISIPFDVSGYTNLVVDYFTLGDTKIVRDESGLTVADGYITAEFSGHDLDLLPDGVVRYTIEYAVDNTDYVESSNTMLYLKTPASYDSITPEEIYQSGYTAGYDDCGEGDCSEIQNIAYNSGLTVGYESGYTAGQDDCPLDCDAAYDSGYTQGYQGGYGVGYQGGYSQGYQGGYSQGQADCPDCPACDCTEAYDSGYTQGYQGGYQGGYSVGYQGGYGVGYQGGYAQGQADCPDCPACDCTEAYQSGLTVGAAEQKSKLGSITRTTNGTYTTTGDGWSSVTVNVTCPSVNPLKCVAEFSLDEDYTFPSGNEPYAIWIGPNHAYTVLLDDELVALWEGQTLHAGNHKAEVSNSMISNTELWLFHSIGYIPNGGGESVPTQVTITSIYLDAS